VSAKCKSCQNVKPVPEIQLTIPCVHMSEFV